MSIEERGLQPAPHTVPCMDITPKTVCPARTIGGTIRTMDNHQLAFFLSLCDDRGMSEDEWFKLLNEPSAEWMASIREHREGA